MTVEFLEWLSNRVNGHSCLFALVVSQTHRTPRLQEGARELRIELLFVSAGGTSQFQPRERCVFGELKSRARRAFKRLAWQTGTRGTSHEQALVVFVRAWEEISGENLRSAWELESGSWEAFITKE
jgi:hypothetical protein